MRFTIVTGANASFWPILADLVNSIRDHPGGKQAAISVLDLGLEEDQLAKLDRFAAKIVKPGWDLDFPDRDEMPEWFKAMVARPFLPDYFPGYDVYMWLDSDTWVQDWRCVEYFLRAAAEGSLAIVPEVDRCMVPDWRGEFRRIVAMSRDAYQQGWDEATANALGPLPMLNSGAFALRADAPHWAAWRESLAESLPRTSNFMVEQTALNHAVYTRDLPAVFLPFYCNYLCHVAHPKVHRATARLVEPQPPYRALGVVHLANRTKNGKVDLVALDGPPVHATFRYEGVRRGLAAERETAETGD